MIHRKLIQLRGESGLSQQDVAERLNLARATYANIELGKRQLNLSELQTLARLYELSTEQLLSDLPESEKPTISRPVTASNATTPEDSSPIQVIEDPEKFKQVLLYVLEKVGAKANVGETVLYKLLYFIDFDYFEKFQQSLTGTRYIRNHFGPTPVSFNQMIESMQKQDEIDITSGQYFKYKQRKYMPRVRPDLTKLSAQELEHIDEVLFRLSDKTATDLSHLSHRDIPWQTAEPGEAIDYMTVFYRDWETSVRDHSNDEL